MILVAMVISSQLAATMIDLLDQKYGFCRYALSFLTCFSTGAFLDFVDV